jgi:uncharacterized membrane protein
MGGPAIVSEAANRHIVDLDHTPLAWLGSGHAARTSAILALGELVADKLPSTPNRTIPPSLAIRALSGAICGYAVCGQNHSKSEKWIAAGVGAAAALAASWLGFQYRKHVPLPAFIAAITEDAFTFAAGSAVINTIGR